MSDKRMARMPYLQWSENADYDTLVSVLMGWVVDVHMTDDSVVSGEVYGLNDYGLANAIQIAQWHDDQGGFDKEDIVLADLDCVEAIIVQ